MIKELATALEPWKTLFDDSAWLSTGTTTLHILATMIGGGLAIAADRSTLRVSANVEDRNRLLTELESVHRPVIVAIVVLFITGVGLAAADVETFLPSPYFWVKISLVTLLLVNGGVLALTERSLLRGGIASGDARSDGLWSRLRLTSVLSIVLWCATLIAGTLLVNA